MATLNNKKTSHPARNIFFRIVVCILVLAGGIFGMTRLASLKKPPAEAPNQELPLQVDAVRMMPEDVPVVITGYGQVKSLNEVSLASEVSGTVIDIHPRLEVGEIIPQGETLFRIDPRNYEAAYKEAQATKRQWLNTILRLKKQLAIDRDRLKTLARNRELARLEFQRLSDLYEKDRVGTKTGMEKGEQAYNAARDQEDKMGQAIALYPIQIKEAESHLASAEARLTLAEANLDRCHVTAPFNGRIKAVKLEKGQYVAPGQNVITLADDAVLEIHVPLDSRDARQWLRFDGARSNGLSAWFSGLEKVSCEIRWTEDISGLTWPGRVDRIVRFDQQTRTLTVAVRIEAESAKAKGDGALPLVEGMFCAVDIPGKTMTGVFRLPRWAVSFKNTVFLAVDQRLKTVPVKVARVEGETAVVSHGLKAGDVVVSTRLVDPLENALLEITHISGPGSSS